MQVIPPSLVLMVGSVKVVTVGSLWWDPHIVQACRGIGQWVGQICHLEVILHPGLLLVSGVYVWL